MKIKYKHLYYIIFICALLMTSGIHAAPPVQEIWHHPKAVKIECPKGPYVRLQNGEIMTAFLYSAMVSADNGKSWKSMRIFDPKGSHVIGTVRNILQTRTGAILVLFGNSKEGRWKWNKNTHDTEGDVRLPTYVIRSTDNGRTWSKPQLLQTEWMGAINDILQTRDGRIVASCMILLHNPGRHAIVTYSSTDDGLTWRRSNIIDLGGMGNHDGAMEATIEELKDGRIWMLIRTNWDYFWDAFSEDGGQYWRSFNRSQIKASATPALVQRLTDGRLVMVWNQLYPEGTNDYKRLGGDGNWSEVPSSTHRKELSISFSADEAMTWTKPIVIGRAMTGYIAKPLGPEVSYPSLLEISPGVLLISTLRGDYAALININEL